MSICSSLDAWSSAPCSLNLFISLSAPSIVLCTESRYPFMLLRYPAICVSAYPLSSPISRAILSLSGFCVSLISIPFATLSSLVNTPPVVPCSVYDFTISSRASNSDCFLLKSDSSDSRIFAI